MPRVEAVEVKHARQVAKISKPRRGGVNSRTNARIRSLECPNLSANSEPMVLSTEDDPRPSAAAQGSASPPSPDSRRNTLKPGGPRERAVSTLSSGSWATMTAATTYLALLEGEDDDALDGPEPPYATSTYTTAESDIASTIENWESTLDLSSPSTLDVSTLSAAPSSEPSSASTIVGHGGMFTPTPTSSRNRRHQLIDGSLLADLRGE